VPPGVSTTGLRGAPDHGQPAVLIMPANKPRKSRRGWTTAIRASADRSCPLDTLVPEHPNTPYDIKELITRCVDGASSESGARLCPQHRDRLRAGCAGDAVGIVANSAAGAGRLWTSRASIKARPVSCGSAMPSTIRSVTCRRRTRFMPHRRRSTAASSSPRHGCCSRTADCTVPSPGDQS